MILLSLNKNKGGKRQKVVILKVNAFLFSWVNDTEWHGFGSLLVQIQVGVLVLIHTIPWPFQILPVGITDRKQSMAEEFLAGA